MWPTAGVVGEDSLISSIEVSHLTAAPEGRYWMHVRPGVIPQKEVSTQRSPIVVLTMQLTDDGGTHMFHGISSMWSDDLGQTWHGPVAHDSLARREQPGGLIEVPVDSTPAFHLPTRKLLLTGATFWLDPKINRDIRGGPSDTSYSVYDSTAHQWSDWQKLKMPNDPRFRYARAGCTQRVDLPNGEILLPIYFGGDNNSIHSVTIVRCQFDGKQLTYMEHGNEMSVDFGRGFGEPSLTRFRNRFYLTLRNDKQGYVTASSDGLHFDEPRVWTFDDGEPLGNYNTQQHWGTHSDGLFLAYTRRGVDNDEIFRHRSPVLISRVDHESLQVIRSSEQVLLPKLKDGFGNFGVCNITSDETWATAGRRKAAAGEPSVYLARIKWAEKNRLVETD